MKNKILYAEVVTYSKLFSFAGIKLSHIFFVSISFLLDWESSIAAADRSFSHGPIEMYR